MLETADNLQEINTKAAQHEPISLKVEVGGTVFLVRHIFTGDTTLDDIYYEFLARKIDNL